VARGRLHAPAALYPRERPGTHFTGGWVGPRAGLDRWGKSRPTGIRSPDRPALSQSLYLLDYLTHKFFTDSSQFSKTALILLWVSHYLTVCPVTSRYEFKNEYGTLAEWCWQQRDLRQSPFSKHVPHTFWACLKVAVRSHDNLSCKGFSNYGVANMLTKASRCVRVQCLLQA
jgi:hypothetical protein